VKLVFGAHVYRTTQQLRKIDDQPTRPPWGQWPHNIDQKIGVALYVGIIPGARAKDPHIPCPMFSGEAKNCAAILFDQLIHRIILHRLPGPFLESLEKLAGDRSRRFGDNILEDFQRDLLFLTLRN
jgi:hypothetical protein